MAGMVRGVLFVLLVGWLVIVHALAALLIAWVSLDGGRFQTVLDGIAGGQALGFVALVAGPTVVLYFALAYANN